MHPAFRDLYYKNNKVIILPLYFLKGNTYMFCTYIMRREQHVHISYLYTIVYEATATIHTNIIFIKEGTFLSINPGNHKISLCTVLEGPTCFPLKHVIEKRRGLLI